MSSDKIVWSRLLEGEMTTPFLSSTGTARMGETTNWSVIASFTFGAVLRTGFFTHVTALVGSLAHMSL
jgi:hypothetical protein